MLTMKFSPVRMLDRAVERVRLVVHVGAQQRLRRREQLEPHDEREDAPHREGDEDADEVHHPDPLVIDGGQPRHDPALGADVVAARS
jgi:hypothetical protein